MARLDASRQVLAWLSLPEAERPSFVSLYFEEVDDAGHDFGPDSPELAAAAAQLDDALGALIDGVRAARPRRSHDASSSCPITA